MYFYIDESGHTGTNLFDPNQPALCYGVVSAHASATFNHRVTAPAHLGFRPGSGQVCHPTRRCTRPPRLRFATARGRVN